MINSERKNTGVLIVFCVALSILLLYVQKTINSLSHELSQSNSFSSKLLRTYDVTVLTHTSTQRLFYIPYIVNRWAGPISMTVFIISSEDEQALNALLTQNLLPKTITLTRYYSPTPTEYPYNKLRNMALKKISTSHFWVMDMDMWPSDNLYSTLLSLDSRYLNDDYLAVIVPSFELKSDTSKCTDFEQCVKDIIPYIPHTFIELQNCIAVEKCDEFRKNYFVHNYMTPDWYRPDTTQQLMLVPCFKSFKQEPYVMVKRSSHLPLFDERFINYGKDKISWIENLRYDGYKFAVIRGAFAVDIPHPRSDYAKRFYDVVATEGASKWDMNIIYSEFRKELSKKKDNSIVYFCDESDNASSLVCSQTLHTIYTSYLTFTGS